MRAEARAGDEAWQTRVTLTLVNPTTKRIDVPILAPGLTSATVAGEALAEDPAGSGVVKARLEAGEAQVVEISGTVEPAILALLPAEQAGWYGRSRGPVLQPVQSLVVAAPDSSPWAGAVLALRLELPGGLPASAVFAPAGSRYEDGTLSWDSTSGETPPALTFSLPLLDPATFVPRDVAEAEGFVSEWRARRLSPSELERERVAIHDASAARVVARFAVEAASATPAEVVALPDAEKAPPAAAGGSSTQPVVAVASASPAPSKPVAIPSPPPAAGKPQSDGEHTEVAPGGRRQGTSYSSKADAKAEKNRRAEEAKKERVAHEAAARQAQVDAKRRKQAMGSAIVEARSAPPSAPPVAVAIPAPAPEKAPAAVSAKAGGKAEEKQRAASAKQEREAAKASARQVEVEAKQRKHAEEAAAVEARSKAKADAAAAAEAQRKWREERVVAERAGKLEREASLKAEAIATRAAAEARVAAAAPTAIVAAPAARPAAPASVAASAEATAPAPAPSAEAGRLPGAVARKVQAPLKPPPETGDAPDVPWIRDAAQARVFLARERARGALDLERVQEAVALVRARHGDVLQDSPRWRERFEAEGWYQPGKALPMLAQEREAVALLRQALEPAPAH